MFVRPLALSVLTGATLVACGGTTANVALPFGTGGAGDAGSEQAQDSAAGRREAGDGASYADDGVDAVGDAASLADVDEDFEAVGDDAASDGSSLTDARDALEDRMAQPHDARTEANDARPDRRPDASPDATLRVDGGDGEASTETDAADDASFCPTATNQGPLVPVDTNDSGALPPLSMGGTILSGTYVLTSVTSFGSNGFGCRGMSMAETVVFAASSAAATSGTFDGVVTTSLVGVTLLVKTVHASYMTSGSTLSSKGTCPADPAGTVTLAGYTATVGQLTVTEASLGGCGTLVEVFTAQ